MGTVIVTAVLVVIVAAIVFSMVKGKKNGDRKSTRLNSSHYQQSRMPSSA